MKEFMTSAAIKDDDAFGMAFGRVGVEPMFGLNPGSACVTAPMVAVNLLLAMVAEESQPAPGSFESFAFAFAFAFASFQRLNFHGCWSFIVLPWHVPKNVPGMMILHNHVSCLFIGQQWACCFVQQGSYRNAIRNGLAGFTFISGLNGLPGVEFLFKCVGVKLDAKIWLGKLKCRVAPGNANLENKLFQVSQPVQPMCCLTTGLAESLHKFFRNSESFCLRHPGSPLQSNARPQWVCLHWPSMRSIIVVESGRNMLEYVLKSQLQSAQSSGLPVNFPGMGSLSFPQNPHLVRVPWKLSESGFPKVS